MLTEHQAFYLFFYLAFTLGCDCYGKSEPALFPEWQQWAVDHEDLCW